MDMEVISQDFLLKPKPLFLPSVVDRAIRETAGQLAHDLKIRAIKRIAAIFILDGAIFFGVKLVNYLHGFYPELDWEIVTLRASRGWTAGKPRQEVIIEDRHLPLDLRDKNILLIDDIGDDFITIRQVIDYLRQQHYPRSIRVALMTVKDKGRVPPDLGVPLYCALTVPDKFVVGHGLDFKERFRQLPYIGYLELPPSD